MTTPGPAPPSSSCRIAPRSAAAVEGVVQPSYERKRLVGEYFVEAFIKVTEDLYIFDSCVFHQKSSRIPRRTDNLGHIYSNMVSR